MGTIASYATEVALPATGTWANPGKGGAQADIIITAPEDGVPLLFAEIDNYFESAKVLAAKIDKYMRYCQRKVKDVDGKERPMWRTHWWVPDGRHGDRPHPPLLLVFNLPLHRPVIAEHPSASEGAFPWHCHRGIR
ncbi:hypothetical protein [Streptomyces sp. NPDC059176]|uniref:hypothetical protein n=1 Tax=Streptomyces sp. NPDC059176 TaxID=3346758 RepID=UPI0036C05CAC